MTEERSCVYHDSHRRLRCTECGIAIDLCECSEPDHAAHNRLWSPDGKMIRAIRGELQQAREAFPNTHYMHAALIEEVGELAKALMEHSLDGSVTAAEVFHEAIQVATMAIRIGTEGDRDFSYEPYAIFPEENSLP